MKGIIMDDMDVSGSQDTSAPVQAETQVSAPPESKQERLFKQQEVADLLTRERKEAVERYKRSAQPAQSQSPQQHQSNISTDDVRRIAAEETQNLMEKTREDAQRNAQMQEAERTASEFFGKLAAGKEKYDDFDAVMGSVKDWGKLASAVGLANLVDNTHDVMYDLIKNPTKIAQIHSLAEISPDLALAEVQRMSAAHKLNEKATKTKMPNAPLSQMRPSNTGTDSGDLSVSDYKKKYGPNYNWNRR
jgi:hypothetical protein